MSKTVEGTRNILIQAPATVTKAGRNTTSLCNSKRLVFATAAIGTTLLNGVGVGGNGVGGIVSAFTPFQRHPQPAHHAPYSTLAGSSFVSLGETTFGVGNTAYLVVSDPRSRPRYDEAVRLHASGGRNGNKEKGFLGKAKDVVKSILPAKWFKSEEEKRAEIERKRLKEEISGGLSELFKDAPLAVRGMAKLIGPLFSSIASGLAETTKSQQRQMDDLLADARSYIVSDESAASALGEPIEIGPPFSQCRSSSNINGQVSNRIQASFEVRGSYQVGVAIMSANEAGIQSLVLRVGARTMNINLSGSSSRPYESSTGPFVEIENESSTGPFVEILDVPKSRLGKNRINKDNVIDVEFVEKTHRKSLGQLIGLGYS